MPKVCEYETCRAYANYGEFYGKPLRCKEHKGDYKLVSQLCHEGNCKIIPIYNKEGETKALYCSQHKLDGMIDIIHNACFYENCKTRPIYNYNGENKPLYCLTHKLDGMVNVVSKKCVYSKCKKQPCFNYNGEKIALYCSEHKKEEMINVKDKTCIHPNCKTRPSYNFEGKMIGLYCSIHKLDGMVDIYHKRCLQEGCKTQPTYNIEGEKTTLYCSTHKKEGMIDIKHKKCKANYCLGTLANSKYKGYCATCYQQLFPTDPLTLQIRCKTKEITVQNYINLNFEGFQHDKPLYTGNCDCTHRRRIDHRKLIGNTLLCIETDEEQHKGYDKDDEEIRYDDLYMLHSGKFIFIRFNPDKFKDKNGKSINPMMYTRLPILKEEIEKQIKRIENEENKELLEIIKLYYDEIKN